MNSLVKPWLLIIYWAGHLSVLPFTTRDNVYSENSCLVSWHVRLLCGLLYVALTNGWPSRAAEEETAAADCNRIVAWARLLSSFCHRQDTHIRSVESLLLFILLLGLLVFKGQTNRLWLIRLSALNYMKSSGETNLFRVHVNSLD